MNDEVMTIRAMCDEFHVTPRTLRFYEAKELIFPIREGQRRWFTRRDRARLRLILEGKKYGFALEDIRQLLDLYDQGEDGPVRQLVRAMEMASQRLSEMEVERVELDAAIAQLSQRLAWGQEQLEELRRNAA